MEGIKIIAKIIQFMNEFVKEQFMDHAGEIIKSINEEKTIEKLYTEIFTDINENINDEYEQEKVHQYIADNTPCLSNYESIFDRNKFIEEFYKKNPSISKNERIDLCLIKTLDEIEGNLDFQLKEKLLYKKCEEIQRELEQLKGKIEHLKDEEKEEVFIDNIKNYLPILEQKLIMKHFQMYKNIEKNEYEDQIKYLKDKFIKSWKKNILEVLLCDKKRKEPMYEKMVCLIKGDLEYESVYDILNELYINNEWEGKNEQFLRDVLKKAKFDKVYLLVGNLGSGKTFFLRNFIKKMNQQIVLINLNEYDLYNMDIEQLMRKAFASLIGIKCSSLEEMNEWGIKLKCKVCFLIENIQGLHSYNKQKFKKLISNIKSYTKYDEFVWFITISESDFYILKEDERFLNNYCFGDQREYDNFVNNAFNLNMYNVKTNVVDRILQSYGITQIKQNTNTVDVVLEPLYAHIIGERYKGQNIIFLAETCYDLITELNCIMDKKIKNVDEAIIEFELVLLEKVYKNKTVNIEKQDLQQYEQQISELRQLQLLSVIEETENDVFSLKHMKTTQTICLKTEIFWALKIMLFHVKKEEGNRVAIITELLKYDYWLQELLILIYISYLLNNSNKFDDVIDILFNKKKGIYVFFCTKNANEQYDNMLYTYLKSRKVKADCQTTYGLLYFIFYSRLSAVKKVELLMTYAHHIEMCNLFDIYENVVKSLFSNFEDEDEVQKTILKLVQCNVQQINVINGYVLGDIYTKIMGKRGVDLLDCLKKIQIYIKNNQEILNSISYRDAERNSRNNSFIDYWVRAIFENYIRDKGVICVYKTCSENKIFILKKGIGKCFKRNFSCAAGNVYNKKNKNDTFKSEYVKLIWQLARSKEEKFTAMFLIINGLDSLNDYNFIDDDLLKAFEHLWQYADVQRFFKQFNEVKWILRQYS